MRKHLKKAFIPHAENNFDPHILRHTGVLLLTLIAFISFAFSAFHAAVLISNSNLLAAIFPAVLTDLTNESRIENNNVPLSTNDLLIQSAQAKANHMAENSYFAHNSPDGVTPWSFIIEAGYRFTHAGENLAVNFVDSKDVVDAWLDSPGHRANILNDNFTEIGIATAEGTFQGRTAVFVVQHFGRPSASVLPPASVISVAEAEEPAPVIAGESETAPEEVFGEPTPPPALTFTEVAVTSESDMSIEVETNEPAPSDGEEAGAAAEGLRTQESSWYERIVSQPRQLLTWIYALLALVIVIALTVAILVEIERHHPKHIGFSVLLLMLLIALLYLNRVVIFPDLLIV